MNNMKNSSNGWRLSDDQVTAFESAGFKRTQYHGQSAEFLTLHTTARDINHSSIDGEYISDDSECVVEVTPLGTLQIYFPESDHIEKYDIDDNLEDWKIMAKSCGVELAL